MFAGHVTQEYRALVRSRFLAILIVLTFTVIVCFWSIEISLAIYLLLLLFYVIPGKLERRHSRTSFSAD